MGSAVPIVEGHNAMPTLGFLIGTTIAVILLLGSAIIGLLAFRQYRKDKYSDVFDLLDSGAAVVGSVIVFVATLGLSLWQWFPYNMAYHSYRPQSGVVQQVSSRILGDSNSVSQKFVVLFRGNPQEYGCTDTRCALIRPGDSVSLDCKKVWVYGGADGYDCNFVRRTPKR